jgi:hypothetical protein
MNEKLQEWLEKNSDIEVKHIAQSQEHGIVLFTILYEKKK